MSDTDDKTKDAATVEITVAGAFAFLIREGFIDTATRPCRKCFEEHVERNKAIRDNVAGRLDLESKNVKEPAKAALRFAWQAWNAYLIALGEPLCERHGGRPPSNRESTMTVQLSAEPRISGTRPDGSK